MDRNEVKFGMGIMGVGVVYFGIKGICTWLVNRTFVLADPHVNNHIVGKVSQEIGIYSYKDNPKRWSNLDKPVTCETFDLVPAYFRIEDQTDDRIVIEMPTKKVICKLDPSVDLRLNVCTLFKVTPSIDGNYNGILNHPTQLGIILRPGRQVILRGYLDGNDVFQIQCLSNYPVNKYKGILVAQKILKAGFLLFGMAAFGGLAILFSQFKE
jgi:hypothetical protein